MHPAYRAKLKKPTRTSDMPLATELKEGKRGKLMKTYQGAQSFFHPLFDHSRRSQTSLHSDAVNRWLALRVSRHELLWKPVKRRHVDDDGERGTRRSVREDVCCSTVWQQLESCHVAAQRVTIAAFWDASVCRKQRGSTPYFCTVWACSPLVLYLPSYFHCIIFPFSCAVIFFILNRGSQVHVDMTGKDPHQVSSTVVRSFLDRLAPDMGVPLGWIMTGPAVRRRPVSARVIQDRAGLNACVVSPA